MLCLAKALHIIIMAFQVTGETLIRRSDDNPEALKKRLATYHRETVPLIAFYKTRNLHRMVDASQKTEVVFDNIKKIFADARGELTSFRYELEASAASLASSDPLFA